MEMSRYDFDRGLNTAQSDPAICAPFSRVRHQDLFSPEGADLVRRKDAIPEINEVAAKAKVLMLLA